MTDRPILFSAPMVRALLDGRKTQTRRLAYFADIPVSYLSSEAQEHYELLGYRIDLDKAGNAVAIAKPRPSQRWKIGDRLYVREHWRAEARLDKKAPRDINTHYPGIKYVATDEPDDFGIEGKHRQAMHMPRWASRLTLPVTNVRVERLQDISEEDAIAEGVERLHGGWFPYGITTFMTTVVDGREVPAQYCQSARDSYQMLWDHINGRGSWEANPWVTATTFEVIKQNIDEVAA